MSPNLCRGNSENKEFVQVYAYFQAIEYADKCCSRWIDKIEEGTERVKKIENLRSHDV